MTIASGIEQMLSAEPYNFEVYVAKNVQSIFEINSGIIRELKNSDYYLFLNFRRGQPRRWKRGVPGSVFSNQEFAIAYALGFDRILVVNQKGVSQEGMLRYCGCNTEQFQGRKDCLAVVRRAWDRTGWLSDYSRRLQAEKARFGPLIYGSEHIQLEGQMLYLNIHNGRPDIAAIETTAKLVAYKQKGSAVWTPSEIQSALKASGKPAYSHTIFPRSGETFDLLCIGTSQSAAPDQRLQVHVYLNSALDLIPTRYLAIIPGTWELQYQCCAIGFPLLTIIVELLWPVNGMPSGTILRQEAS
jgi:hypothetical protein